MRFFKEYAMDDFVRTFYPMDYYPEKLTWVPAGGNDIVNRRVESCIYHSLWAYPHESLEKPILHYIIFDFDFPVLETARLDTENFLKQLQQIYDVNVDSLGIYFSGRKGFHVVMPTAMLVSDSRAITDGVSGLTPDMIKAFAYRLAMGFKSFDTATFDGRRLFRKPGALHKDTKLKKTQVTAGQIYYGGIPMLTTGNGTTFEVEEPSYCPALNELMMNVAVAVRPEERMINSTLADLFDPAPTGQRNNQATQLAGLLTKTIADASLIREILRCWNRTNRHPLSETELDTITTGVFNRYHKRHTETQKKGTTHAF